MKLLDIVTAPWAIQPEKLMEIRDIYATHLRGEKIDLKAVEAALGRPLNNQPKGYQVVDGVAVLPIEGVIAKRMSLFTQISGGTSSALALQDFQQALQDPSVNAIILQVDSPGGAVDGTPELANAIFQARDIKPVVAYADGLMASAAYWIGAAAEKVYMSSDVTQVGSIGVVATHVDVSKAEEARGVKTTEITAGKFKRIASQFGPLSPEGRQSIQDQVDAMYSVMLNDVAKFRGAASPDVVHERMADGRIFTGQQAIEAGLVDGVSTLMDLIGQLSQGGATASPVKRAQGAVSHPVAETNDNAAGAAAEPEPHKENPMNIEQLKADHPDLFKAVHDEAEAEGKEAGATAERERIKAVFARSMPGHEALVNTLAFDGKTTGPEAADAILTAEREKRGKVMTGLVADAVKPVPPAPAPEEGADASGEAALKKEWDESDSTRALFANDFDAFAKARTTTADAEKNGRIRIFRKN